MMIITAPRSRSTDSKRAGLATETAAGAAECPFLDGSATSSTEEDIIRSGAARMWLRRTRIQYVTSGYDFAVNPKFPPRRNADFQSNCQELSSRSGESR